MSASAPSFDWNAGSPAHDSHGDGSFVCSFLSSLSNVSDDDLFSSLYAVLIGYALLIFAPSWPKTKSITLFLSGVYSLMYLALLVRCVVAHPELSETGVDFGSLQGVVKLFKDESVVFAGWTHYIAFDLFVARYITMDAQIHGIPHILVVPLIPLTLVAGPVGLCFYLVLKSLYTFFRRPVNAGAHTNEERADDAAGREAPVSVHRQHLRKSVCKNRLRLWVYLGLCSLCVFMVVWIFHMPGTFRLGFESTRVQHAQTLDDMYRGDVKVPLWGKLNLEKLFGQLNVFTTPGSTNGAENGLDAGGTAQTLRYALPVTPDVLFKYDRQTLVVALHHIPAGVWSMLIPLQLYTPLRRKFPRVHRVMGYVFALSSLLVTAGVCVIMHRRLDFISYNAEASTAIGQTDDADSGGSSTGDDTSRGTGAGSGASDFDRSFPSEWGFGDKYLLYSIMWVITAYFFVSVLQLVRYAKNRQFLAHQKWVVRHIGAGIWIALQRLYVFVRYASTPRAKHAAFADGAVLSIVFCVVVSELYIYTYLRREQKVKAL